MSCIHKNLKTAFRKLQCVHTALMESWNYGKTVEGDKDFNLPFFGDAQMRIVMEREQNFLVVTKMDDFML